MVQIKRPNQTGTEDKTHSHPQKRHKIGTQTALVQVLCLSKSWLLGISELQSQESQLYRLNDVQRTFQAAFHVVSCVLGTEDEGILYPENTQLF